MSVSVTSHLWFALCPSLFCWLAPLVKSTFCWTADRSDCGQKKICPFLLGPTCRISWRYKRIVVCQDVTSSWPSQLSLFSHELWIWRHLFWLNVEQKLKQDDLGRFPLTMETSWHHDDVLIPHPGLFAMRASVAELERGRKFLKVAIFEVGRSSNYVSIICRLEWNWFRCLSSFHHFFEPQLLKAIREDVPPFGRMAFCVGTFARGEDFLFRAIDLLVLELQVFPIPQKLQENWVLALRSYFLQGLSTPKSSGWESHCPQLKWPFWSTMFGQTSSPTQPQGDGCVGSDPALTAWPSGVTDLPSSSSVVEIEWWKLENSNVNIQVQTINALLTGKALFRTPDDSRAKVLGS